MSGEAGDEFAEETKRTVSEVLQYMRYASMGRGMHGSWQNLPGNGHFKTGKNLNRGESSTEENDHAEESLLADSEDNLRPDAIVVAGSVADAEFLRGLMDENNLDYSVLRERTAEGAFEFVFRLPDVENEDRMSVHLPFSKVDHTLIPSGSPFTSLSEFGRNNPEAMAVLEHFMVEGERINMGAYGDKVNTSHFDPDSPENFKFDFTTVEWDREAEILTSFFEERGIPYCLEDLDFETVRFFLHPEYAEEVKFVCDLHINNKDKAKRVSEKRFLDYEALSDPTKRISIEPSESQTAEARKQPSPPQTAIDANARTEVLSVTIEDASKAHILKQNLSAENIAFESFWEKATGAERFVVSKEELAAKAERLDVIERRVENMTNKEIGNAVDMSRVKAPGKTARDNLKSKTAPDRGRRGYSTDQKHSPVKDEQVAKRSAVARNKAAQANVRKPSKTL